MREIYESIIVVWRCTLVLIYSKMTEHHKVDRYKRSLMFGDGKSGEKMVKILETIDLTIKKKLNYL